MPLILGESQQIDVADKEELLLPVTGDASYPTGGYDFLPDLLPFRCRNTIDAVSGNSDDGAYYFVYDAATGKVLIFEHASGTEVADTTDLSAMTATLRVLGR